MCGRRGGRARDGRSIAGERAATARSGRCGLMRAGAWPIMRRFRDPAAARPPSARLFRSPVMDVKTIQQALREQGVDGWLLCDFRNRDFLSYKVLGLDY